MIDRWRRSRCFILHEKIIDSILDRPSSRDTLLSLTHDKQTFESSDESRSDMKFDHLVDEKKGDGYKVRDKGAKWKNKEKFDDDRDKSKTFLLPFIKKRCRFVARERSSSQRRIKRRRYSPPYRDEAVDNQGECEMRISCSRSKGHLIFYRYPNCSSGPGPGRQYLERRCFSCKVQYRQYPPILSSILESLASSCIATNFRAIFTQR